MKMALSFLGLVCLLAILLLCLAGLLSGRFDDNLLHCAGLAALLLWSASEIRLLLLTGHLTGRELWLYAGVLSFGSGTALRTWLYTRKRRGCSV